MYKKAFTLTELMLVVVIIGILAGFALPNYTRSLERGYARDAVIQLTALYFANQIYKAHNGNFLNTSGADFTDSQINQSLNINIIPSSTAITYTYNSATGAVFQAKARYVKGSTDYTIRVNEANLSNATGGNPCCSAGCTNLKGSVPSC